jgi:tetratricopeptide (TPR) repeat protein
MGTWVGWLFILLAIYVLALLLRGLLNLVAWLREEVTGGPATVRHTRPAGERLPKESAPPPAAASRPHAKHTKEPPAEYRGGGFFVTLSVALTSRLASLGQWLRDLTAKRSYDHWITAALRADDPRKKADYCSKALRLNPGYVPAWGLKGNALLEMHRYEEAIACFDQVLQADPNPLIWSKKGDCCCRLDRLGDAIDCFNKALAACSPRDRELSELVKKKKQHAELSLD